MFKQRHFLIIIFLQFFLSAIIGQEFTQRSNLPTFYINTNNGVAVTSKDTYVSGKLTIVSSDPTEEFSDSTEIRGRGNSTWGMDKKPYRLKLYNKNSLLNSPAVEKNWVLLANYADKTLMRNSVAFRISELVGMEFTLAYRLVDVVFNGQYLGVYMMSDHKEVAKHRIDIETQKASAVTEPDITGGYLLEIDGFASAEPKHFYTGKGMPITVKYPKDDKINDTQFNYIRDYTQFFEDKLFSDNFTDPVDGYRPYIDEHTLVNWYIACELTGNSDSFWSTYIYKRLNDPKFYVGPLWDFDIAFNNDNRLGDATRKLMREHAHSYRHWIVRMWQDPWFRDAVNARWEELVNDGIEQKILDFIDETQADLQQSQALNFQRWPNLNQVVYREVYVFSTYDEGVDYLKSYVRDRVDFLNNGFINDSEVQHPPYEPDEDTFYCLKNRRSGNVIDLDGDKLVMWEYEKDKKSQHWQFVSVGKDQYRMINRETGKSVTLEGERGSQALTSDYSANNSFAWEVVSTGVANYYALKNMEKSTLYLNNSGGGMDNGTLVIGWDSNVFNSDNVKFSFVEVGQIDTSVSKGFAGTMRVVFNPNAQTIQLFDTAQGAEQVAISIYSINGAELLRVDNHSVAQPLDVSHLARGVYTLRVADSKYNFTTKFIR